VEHPQHARMNDLRSPTARVAGSITSRNPHQEAGGLSCELFGGGVCLCVRIVPPWFVDLDGRYTVDRSEGSFQRNLNWHDLD